MRKKKKIKSKMDGTEISITTQVISEVARSFDIQCVEIGDDDVFLDQVPNGDVYSDIPATFANDAKSPTAEEIRSKMAGQTRPRRTSDVIDSLGEEVVMRRGSSSDPFCIPVSPNRSRLSSDLGYGGSFASSPASHFNFPAPAIPSGVRRYNYNCSTVTDSKPIAYDVNPELDSESKEARMPVARDAESYNMSHPRRGRAVIFNNDLFENHLAAPRKGSHVDVDVMVDTFTGLGFQVTVFDNLTHHEIKEQVNNLSREDHSDADCVAITVLTHGLDNGLLYARDALYRVDTLWGPFTANNCLSLAGKPKLFFVQACRGERLDSGVSLVSQRRSTSETDSGSASYKIPNHCDLLISYSSMEGFYSWRNPEEGTWYIQSLARELKDSGGTRTLLDVLNRVHRRVALHFESNVVELPWMHCQKQVPVFHSTLMRDLVFPPKQ